MNKTVICLLALCLFITGCTLRKTEHRSDLPAETEFPPDQETAAERYRFTQRDRSGCTAKTILIRNA